MYEVLHHGEVPSFGKGVTAVRYRSCERKYSKERGKVTWKVTCMFFRLTWDKVCERDSLGGELACEELLSWQPWKRFGLLFHPARS